MDTNKQDTAATPKPSGIPGETVKPWPAENYTRLQAPLSKAPTVASLDTLDVIGAVWLSHAVGTWQWDLRTDKCLWNKRMIELLGLDPASSEASGTTFFGLMHPEDRPRVERAVARATAAFTHFDEEFRILRPDGQVRWIMARGIAVSDEHGTASEMVGVNLDITERKRDETEIHEVNQALELRLSTLMEAARQRSDQLTEVAAQVLHAEQAERKRIANLLHDNVQQTLIAAILGAEKAKRQTNSASARETLTRVINAVQEVVARTRLLSIQLDPPVLTQGTLSQALSWLANSKRQQYGLQVAYEEGEDLEEPSEAAKHFLFEAARELLFNAVKHSGVQKATMKLEKQDGALCLSIDDDGKGCDPALLRNTSSESGLGLAMISERAAVLGGKVHFDSAPGAGFHAFIRVPVESASTGQ
jgi:two-component system CheB/CheR fusion protein